MDRRLLGSGLGLAWDYLVRFDVIGTRLDSLETFWIHSLGLTLFTSISPGFAWIRLKPFGSTWTDLDSVGIICTNSYPLGFTWNFNLELLGFTWIHLVSLGFTDTWMYMNPLGFDWIHSDSLNFARTH